MKSERAPGSYWVSADNLDAVIERRLEFYDVDDAALRHDLKNLIAGLAEEGLLTVE